MEKRRRKKWWGKNSLLNESFRNWLIFSEFPRCKTATLGLTQKTVVLASEAKQSHQNDRRGYRFGAIAALRSQGQTICVSPKLK